MMAAQTPSVGSHRDAKLSSQILEMLTHLIFTKQCYEVANNIVLILQMRKPKYFNFVVSKVTQGISGEAGS